MDIMSRLGYDQDNNRLKMMQYIWQNPDWPNFTYSLNEVQATLYLYAKAASELAGGFKQISKEDQTDALIDIIVAEAIKTSEIEGEHYTQDDVRSSLRNQLGLSRTIEKVQDVRADSIARLMLRARETFSEDLAIEEFFHWHSLLMKHALSGERMVFGKWRDGPEPMQIISGPLGRERVHYEAPPSSAVTAEMQAFIGWFNKTTSTSDGLKMAGPVRAAISHLYFEVIHPFEDGNGRIGRAIAEKALSQDLGRPVLLSLSSEIAKNSNLYYDNLSKASRGGVDITEWVNYFVRLIYNAQLSAQLIIEFILFKSRFWRQFSDAVSRRQEKVLLRMFAEGVKGFEGGINAKKYMNITGCSKATATRDLTDLLNKGCLVSLEHRGRSTSYALPPVDWVRPPE